MPLTAVLFDLDGTLLDSERLISAAFRHAGRIVLGRDLTEAEVRARWGDPLPVRCAFLAPDRVDALIETYANYYDASHGRLAALFPGIAEMLHVLREGGRELGVVTSKRRRAVEQDLRAFGLAGFMQATVCAEDTAKAKPSPEPVQEALRRLGTPPQDALLVGDGVYDIRAAQAAGVRSAGALWGARDPAALRAAGPDYLVEAPEDIVALVVSA